MPREQPPPDGPLQHDDDDTHRSSTDDGSTSEREDSDSITSVTDEPGDVFVKEEEEDASDGVQTRSAKRSKTDGYASFREGDIVQYDYDGHCSLEEDEKKEEEEDEQKGYRCIIHKVDEHSMQVPFLFNLTSHISPHHLPCPRHTSSII